MKLAKPNKFLYFVYIILGIGAIIKSFYNNELMIGIMLFMFCIAMIGMSEQARQKHNYMLETKFKNLLENGV